MVRSCLWCWLALLSLCAGLAGCRHSTEKLPSNTETFTLKGTVLAADPAANQVTLQHDAVPGFMAAMTMPYKLVDAQILHELHRGDVIRARLLVDKIADGEYTNARLDEIAVLAEARPSYKPESSYHVPAAGDPVPDFHFVNQDARPVHLGQFRGKALLITFIYTRCPLNDFCPRMSRNFAAIEHGLAADPALLAHTQLLSISFDPAFDTPAVLRAYGKIYTGASGFAHWQFVSPSKQELNAVEHFFNMGVTTGSDGSLTHSLSTVLLGPDGKIVAWYPGSEWSPQDVLARINSIVGGRRTAGQDAPPAAARSAGALAS